MPPTTPSELTAEEALSIFKMLDKDTVFELTHINGAWQAFYRCKTEQGISNTFYSFARADTPHEAIAKAFAAFTANRLRAG